MNDKKWLTYWRKNLIDSIKTDIDIEKQSHFEIENFKIESQEIFELDKLNKLFDEEEKRTNEKKGVSNKESENWITINEIQVLISPIKVKPTSENSIITKDNNPKYPFWFIVNIDRKGKLEIPNETLPLFQRKYLEPFANERTEFIFGSEDEIDKATTIGKDKFKDYLDYTKYIKNVFKKAVNQEIEIYTTQGFETINNALILLPKEEINAAIGIIQLYDKILEEKNTPELLKSFITLKNDTQKTPLNVNEFINTNPLHLGQMGSSFPLSISQRKSLYTFLQSNEKVFAVNGPPGTGKTTLLQRIVANKFVESAIIGKNAPIILACSTNNQAVTNIIDSFSNLNSINDELQGRWLPEIEGYATYLTSNSKTDNELKGINYKKYKGEGIFERIEELEYLNIAKSFFLEKSKSYFGNQIFNINDATIKLQNEILEIQSILRDASTKWIEYIEAERLLLKSYLINDSISSKYYSNNFLNELIFFEDINNLEILEKSIIQYFNNEPLFRKIFCLLGLKSAKNNRASEVNIILRNSLIEVTCEFVFSKSSILEKIDSKIKLAKTINEKIGNWKNWKKQHLINGNPPSTEKKYWELEIFKTENNSKANCFYDELDVSFRHKAFQLALHYWEGRYLNQLEDDLPKAKFGRKGLEAIKDMWRRQAMLTPCFVSTFYMAPKFFSYVPRLKTDDKGKLIQNKNPLFDFIDLLIVDEAGQVTPEVGVATFSLAKQAIIVGDVKQIEPVWNISSKIDIINLKKCNLIKDYDDLIYEKEFAPRGFISSSGSIMKMAQNACNFKEKDIEEKGVILVEHRRCYNEIIKYCNELAYNGKLVPLKGEANSDLLFPPMYCIHVDGNSTVSNTIRKNLNEVNAIVTWLEKNRADIEGKYGKIENAVGIITPFVGQKNSLKDALKKAKFDVDILKIGTVHALQGAERPLILFSMVYGKGDTGMMFFDRDNKPNMLNVAVSRAKDNFIVFANTKILNKNAKTPSGILSNHLTYEKINTITQKFIYL